MAWVRAPSTGTAQGPDASWERPHERAGPSPGGNVGQQPRTPSQGRKRRRPPCSVRRKNRSSSPLAATERWPLRLAGDDPASGAFVVAQARASPWHPPAARHRWRQAAKEDAQALHHRFLPHRHRLTKSNHASAHGQAEGENRTLKEATAQRCAHESHDQLRQHLAAFLAARNFPKRLKTPRGLTPHEHVRKIGSENPSPFKSDPPGLASGLYPCPEPTARSEAAIQPIKPPLDDSRAGREIFDAGSLRNDFPVRQERAHGRRLIWLDNDATTPRPRSAIDRIAGPAPRRRVHVTVMSGWPANSVSTGFWTCATAMSSP